VYRKCIYAGAVRWLERDDELRDVYEEVFAKWPELARLAREPMPVLVTDSYVKSAMEAAEVSPFKVDSARHPCKTLGFKQKSVFVKHLPYWQPRTQAVRDISHTTRNRMLNMLKLWSAKGNMKISRAQMSFEISKGRFTAYASRVQLGRGGRETEVHLRPPWRARREEIEFATAVLRLVRLPHGMKMPDFFNDKLTMADANLFFSGVGLVILDMLPSIAEFQRYAFEAEICAWGTTYMRKFSKRKLREQQREMARALTLSEMALPVVCPHRVCVCVFFFFKKNLFCFVFCL
jgi:hypothetical protein